MVTYSNDQAREELKRIRVPLMYGKKEDYFLRLKAAPTLPPPTDLPLPRMSFNMTRLYYDPSRKQQSQLQTFARAATSSAINTQYVPVPYNLDFELSIIVRNTEDGTQIVEQILPFFTPEYTLEIVFVDEIGLSKNVPIVLNNVEWSDDNEGTTDWTMRREEWTLNFTMQSYIFGPTQGAGLIKEANTNLWYYAGSQESGLTLDLTLNGPGFQSYRVGELVYQGASMTAASAIGEVESFNANSNDLSIYIKSGTFITNANIKGSVTNASWNVASIANSRPLATITVTGVPPNANIGDDFGYSVVVRETPNT